MKHAARDGLAPRIALRGAGNSTALVLSRGRTVVGSSAACDYRVVARGVRSKHLVLRWDGRQLSVDRIFEPGSVRIEPRAIRAPLALFGHVHLSVGEAVLAIDAPTDANRSVHSSRGIRSDTTRSPVPILPRAAAPDGNDETRLQPALPALRTKRIRIRRWAVAHFGTQASQIGIAVAVAFLVVFAAALSGRARRPASARAAPPRSVAARTTSSDSQKATMELVVPERSPSAAASLLVSGNVDSARRAYGALADRYPTERVFRVVARSLEKGTVTSRTDSPSFVAAPLRSP